MKNIYKKITAFTLAEIMVVFMIIAVVAGATIGIQKSRLHYSNRFMSYASFTGLKSFVEELIGQGDTPNSDTVASKDATVVNMETPILKTSSDIVVELDSLFYSASEAYNYFTSNYSSYGSCYGGPGGSVTHSNIEITEKNNREADWNNNEYHSYIDATETYTLANGSPIPQATFSFSESCGGAMTPVYQLNITNINYAAYSYKPIEGPEACPDGTTENGSGTCDGGCNETGYSQIIDDTANSGGKFCCPEGYSYSNSQCKTTPTLKKALPTTGAELCTRTVDMLNTTKFNACNKTATDSGPFTAANANFVTSNGVRYFNFGANPEHIGPIPEATDTDDDNFIFTIYVDSDGAQGKSILGDDVTKFYVSRSGRIFVPAPDSKMATDTSYLSATVRYRVGGNFTKVGERLTFQQATCLAGKNTDTFNIRYNYCPGMPMDNRCDTAVSNLSCEVVLTKPGF